MKKFSEKTIRKELKIDAVALGIPSGAAEVFIEKAMIGIKKNIGQKKTITENDLANLLYQELKKYNADLAYVQKNRGRII